jgi:hypothetical protein
VTRADRLVPLALAAAAAAYLWPLRPYGISMNDDGWWLQAVLRMRAGEVLYRDVWVFYAPLPYHAIEWLFAWTGPSVLATRALFGALIVGSVVMLYRVARRFVPPWIAWLPAAAYAIAPGPWHKAYYATCTLGVLLAAARALETPGSARFGVLGLVAGLALVTRQDLGILGLATGIGLALGPARSARHLVAVLAGAAIPVAPFAAWYAAQGALGELGRATFVAAFGQSGAHPPAIARLLAPATFADAPEGRVVGAAMLLPPLVYAALAAVLARRALSRRLTASDWLLAAILGFGAAALLQAWYPLLLLRFLQSAAAFYLAATVAAWWASEALAARGRLARFAPLALLALAAAGFGGAVLFGLPRLQGDLYTGSARVLRHREPVEILGETLYERAATAEDVRLLRAFYAANAAPGEPTLGLPGLSLVNPILERPNPTRVLAEHVRGNFVMTAGQKQVEAERLLASPTRFVVVEQGWWLRGTPADPLLETLRAAFHPVRGYGSLLILERGTDAHWAAFGEILRRALARGPSAADGDAGRRFAEAHPDEPIAWWMLGLLREAGGDRAGAVDAYHRAAALDAADVAPLEKAAGLLLALGRRAEARADFERARAVRDSAALRQLAPLLGR